MSRPISPTVLSSMMAQDSEEGYVILVAITHANIPTPIRVASHKTDFTSNGNVYLACPFSVNLPLSDPETTASVELTIDNVDASIVAGLRSVAPGSAAVGVALSVVTIDLPDELQVGPLAFAMLAAIVTRIVVTGTLSYEPILDRSYPSGRFFPSDFPGMY